MVGLEQVWHSQVREEDPGQEKNLSQSLCQQGDDLQLQRDVDNHLGVGVKKL